MHDFREEFQKLLLSLRIPSGASQEDISDTFRPCLDLISTNIPEKMFRYRAFNEDNFDAFCKNLSFARSPIDYNDPYDALIKYDKETLLSQIKYGATLEGLKDFRRKVVNNEPVPSDVIEIMGETNTALFVRAFKKMSEKQLIGYYNKSKGNLPPFIQNIETFLSAVSTSIQKSSSVICYSEDIQSILMWSHYADSHKGFALQYDNRIVQMKCGACEKRLNGECKQWVLGSIYPVIYSDERFDATEYATYYLKSILSRSFQQSQIHNPDTTVFIKAFLHKSLDWRYEKEWRIILNRAGCCDYSEPIPMETPMPKAIYYGSKISPENKQRLSEKAKEKGIEEYEMYIDDSSSKYVIEYRSFQSNHQPSV